MVDDDDGRVGGLRFVASFPYLICLLNKNFQQFNIIFICDAVILNFAVLTPPI